jgi:hypothetical protein
LVIEDFKVIKDLKAGGVHKDIKVSEVFKVGDTKVIWGRKGRKGRPGQKEIKDIRALVIRGNRGLRAWRGCMELRVHRDRKIGGDISGGIGVHLSRQLKHLKLYQKLSG